MFSVVLSNAGPNGSYDFVLDQPLDNPSGEALSFSFSYMAQDFDGGAASGALTVTANDDAPPAQLLVALAETDGGLIQMEFGADGPAATDPVTLGQGMPVISAPAGETFGTPTVTLFGTFVGVDPGTAFQELGAGESATLDIPYTMVDFDGSSTSGDLLVTFTGVNQDPVFGDGATSGTVTEVILPTGVATPGAASAVISFTDVDYNDTHVATATYVDGSAVWSGASAQNPDIPAQTLTDLAGAVTAQVTAEATHEATGAVTWTASIPDQDLDFLAAGETLTATYNVTVDDNNGGSATEAVVVTFTGADHPPVITSGAQGASLTEAHDPGLGSANPVLDPGFENGLTGWTLVTNDTGNDTVVGGVSNSGAASFEFGQQGSAATLSQTLTTTPGELYTVSFWLENDGGTPNSFTASWDSQTLMSIVDGPAQSFTQYTFDVVASSTSTDLVFAGQDDPSYLHLDDVSVTPTPSIESASGTIAFTDPDLSDTHTVTVEPNSNVGTLTATLGDDATGGQTGTVNWTYTVSDSAIAFLAAGQQQTETYTVDIDDGHGGVAKQDVVITLTGVNEAPVIPPAPELANTNGLVDGGFENGLSGWTLVASDGFSFVSSPPAHDGSASFAFGQVGSPATLSQTLATVAGETYTLSFWLENDAAGSGEIFAASWGDQTLLSLSNTPAQGFTEYSFTVVASNANTTLSFAGQNDSSYWHLDDVWVVPSATQTAAGQFTFTDPDLTDTHTVAVEANSNIGTFTATLGNDATNGTTGTVNWTYSVDDSAIPASLAVGQTETVTYLVDVSDGHGGVATQAVNITLTGINDAPVITSGPQSAQAPSSAGVAAGAGQLTFSDPDLTDTHTVSVEPNNNIGTFTATLGADATGGGTGIVNWAFSLPDTALTTPSLTQTFTIDVSDGNGGVASQTVTVTVVSPGPTGLTFTPSTATNSAFTDNGGGSLQAGDTIGTFAAIREIRAACRSLIRSRAAPRPIWRSIPAPACSRYCPRPPAT